jgi:hypothetical protein
MGLRVTTAIAFALSLGLSASALAAEINSTGTLEDIAGPFGFPQTQTIGQTFTVDATQTSLNGFTLYLRDPGQTGSLTGSTVVLRAYLASWNGAEGRADTILYTSGNRTMQANGMQRAFAFTPFVPLTEGETYVAFLSVVGLGVQPESAFGMPLNGNVLNGHLVYQNEADEAALTALPWVTGDYPFNDLWLQVSFGDPLPTPTPAPAALGLFGVALAGLALSRRRSRAA